MDDDAFVIRPITQDDFDWIFDLRNKVDLGFTSMPNNMEYLLNRVQTVERSFAEEIPQQERIYLFVRENLIKKERVGISGIQACAGFNSIFYNFQISHITQMNRAMNICLDHSLLNLVDNYQYATELISFWIDPNMRGNKMAKPLSMARMLFLAQFSNLFGEEVIAEIRGVCDKDGKTPFWDAIGRHFFGMEFVTADYLTMVTDKQYIADLMPRSPIYVDLLSPAARNVIGVAHEDALPAQKFLETQGFEYSNCVDIFDAGPLLRARLKDITTVANSKLATISSITDAKKDSLSVLVATTKIKMRVTVGIIVEQESGDIVISKELADILQLSVGDQVRYAEM